MLFRSYLDMISMFFYQYFLFLPLSLFMHVMHVLPAVFTQAILIHTVFTNVKIAQVNRKRAQN